MTGVSDSFKPGGRKRHTMTSRGLGRLTESKSVSRLGYRDFGIYITHWMFPIWHPRYWWKVHWYPAFSMPAIASEKYIPKLKYIQKSFGAPHWRQKRAACLTPLIYGIKNRFCRINFWISYITKWLNILWWLSWTLITVRPVKLVIGQQAWIYTSP